MSAPSSPALPPTDAEAAPALVDLTEAVPASDDAVSSTTTSTTVTTTVHETDDGHVIEEVVEEVVEEELIDAPVVNEPAPDADANADEPVTVDPEEVVDRAVEPAAADDDEAVPEPIAESVTDSGLLVDPPTPVKEEAANAPAAASDAVADAVPPVIDPVAAANAAAAASSAPKCPFAGADAIKDPLADVHQILADNAHKIAAAAARIGSAVVADADADIEADADADADDKPRGRSPAPDGDSDLHIEEEDTADRPAPAQVATELVTLPSGHVAAITSDGTVTFYTRNAGDAAARSDLQVNHQLFAAGWIPTAAGAAVVACAHDGTTYMVDATLDAVQVVARDRVAGFVAGPLAVAPGVHRVCLVYVNFENRVEVVHADVARLGRNGMRLRDATEVVPGLGREEIAAALYAF
ncbi:hypothetical protein AMAG_19107 [Allomyces macrogynus ATCC 38327]|uniref:Uncharacterized protein n=1 Tax=Allomyces macrogynus (strain ATCC 38327) TaxID=578462 RepID=A0A0L0SP35_ALLM3|nr:hypothetical protein AMAG_19107 [Allomyces macrogynus ATCC 38327]|eukprot:KNE64130.1 hypothetical protein AMAG_19107 [Allomyces macrogynus ATCC 38327]